MFLLVVIVLTWKRIGYVGVVRMTYENVNIIPSVYDVFLTMALQLPVTWDIDLTPYSFINSW